MKFKILSLLVFLIIAQVAKSQDQKISRKVSFGIQWAQAQQNDTLYLVILNPAVNADHELTILKSGMKNGKFTFETDVEDSSGIFSIRKRRTYTDDGGSSKFDLLTRDLIWTASDSVNFNFSYYKEGGIGATSAKFTVTGRGALKYNLAREIDSILVFSHKVPPIQCDKPELLFISPYQKQKEAAMAYLEKFEAALNSQEYSILKARINFSFGGTVFGRIYTCFEKMMPDDQERFLMLYEDHIDDLVERPIEKDVLNTVYIDYLFKKYGNESKVRNRGKIDFNWMYAAFMRNEKDEVRDRLISRLFCSERKPDNFKALVDDALVKVKEKYSKAWISRYSDQARGNKLKDFQLYDAKGNIVDISDYKGKVVVIDFWSVGCGGCSLFYKNVISKIKDDFGDRVIFVSVGIDAKRERWINGIKSGLYTSWDEVNLTTGPSSTNHPVFVNNSITATPTAILLNKEGEIAKFNTVDLYSKQGMVTAINAVL